MTKLLKDWMGSSEMTGSEEKVRNKLKDSTVSLDEKKRIQGMIHLMVEDKKVNEYRNGLSILINKAASDNLEPLVLLLTTANCMLNYIAQATMSDHINMDRSEELRAKFIESCDDGEEGQNILVALMLGMGHLLTHVIGKGISRGDIKVE